LILSQSISYADCGKLVTMVLNYNSNNNSASLDSFFKLGEEFCDAGKNEDNANVSVALLDSNKKIIESKKIFISKFVITEKLNRKDPTIFDKTKISKTPQFINIKFSISTDVSKIKFFRVIELGSSKVIGEGVIK
jgi:hypothetical protein